MAMQLTLDKTKRVVEIVAILVAGGFGLFTWGIDQIRLRSDIAANWSLNLADVSGSVFEHVDGTGFCNLVGTLEIENGGKRPLYIGMTELEFFLVERPPAPAGNVNDTTLYSTWTAYCAADACEPDFTIDIGPTDDHPVHPGQTGQRPFSLQFNQTSFSAGTQSMASTLGSKVMVIRANQELGIDANNPKTSTLLYYYHPICSYSDSRQIGVKELNDF